MEKPWKKYIPGLCGALGALLLAGMVRVCFGLERGGTADHAAVAAVLLVLAALALLLIRCWFCCCLWERPCWRGRCAWTTPVRTTITS